VGGGGVAAVAAVLVDEAMMAMVIAAWNGIIRVSWCGPSP
jgi:hypothetical protein